MFSNAFEHLYDVLTEPKNALYRIAKTDSNKEALLIFVISAIITALTSNGLFPGSATTVFVLVLLFGAGGIAIGGAILHLCATVLGGNGSIKGLLRTIPFYTFPQNFLAILPALFSTESSTLASIGGILSTGIGLWSFYLQILAVSENYGISKWRAFFASLLPMIVIIAFAILTVIAVLLLVVQGLMSAPDIMGNINGVPF